MDTARRGVTIERVGAGRLTAANIRGGRISIGNGEDTDFTPTELMLAAIAGCTALDVDVLTSRRSEPDAFEVQIDALKIRDEAGNRLTDIEVTFHVRFPDTAEGERARSILPDAVRHSHDRLCTVGRTVETGTPVTTRIT